MKPLGRKAYGHINHLPASRIGLGDHHCEAGQAIIATESARDKKDVITVTVKLDGSCVAIARIDDVIVPLIRAGHLATSSKYEQHQLFAQWVYKHQGRFLEVLSNGERLVGEWLAQAHGTRYSLTHEPFAAFDLMVGADRLLSAEMRYRAEKADLTTPSVLSVGAPTSVETIVKALDTPRHGELDPVEGAVWRVEREGQFDFICKWVRPDKVDGAYLTEQSGRPTYWNWRPQ